MKNLQVVAILIACMLATTLFLLFLESQDVLGPVGDMFDLEEAIRRIHDEFNPSLTTLRENLLIEMVYANYFNSQVSYYDSEAQTWELARLAAISMYNTASANLSNAENRKAVAESDIRVALDRIYDLGGSTYSSAIDHWRSRLADARARKSNAEADIAMVQSTMEGAEEARKEASKWLYKALSWRDYYYHFEQIHTQNALDLEQQITEKEEERDRRIARERAIAETFRRNNPPKNPPDDE